MGDRADITTRRGQGGADGLLASQIGMSYAGRKILQSVSIDFPAHAVSVLLGPNGCGKSTLLGILATAIAPVEGEVCHGARNVRAALRSFRASLGYAPQWVAFPLSCSARQVLRYVAALKGLCPAQSAPQIDALASRLDIHSWIDERVSNLSSGIRKRLTVAQGTQYSNKSTWCAVCSTACQNVLFKIFFLRLLLRQDGPKLLVIRFRSPSSSLKKKAAVPGITIRHLAETFKFRPLTDNDMPLLSRKEIYGNTNSGGNTRSIRKSD